MHIENDHCTTHCVVRYCLVTQVIYVFIYSVRNILNGEYFGSFFLNTMKLPIRKSYKKLLNILWLEFTENGYLFFYSKFTVFIIVCTIFYIIYIVLFVFISSNLAREILFDLVIIQW